MYLRPKSPDQGQWQDLQDQRQDHSPKAMAFKHTANTDINVYSNTAKGCAHCNLTLMKEVRRIGDWIRWLHGQNLTFILVVLVGPWVRRWWQKIVNAAPEGKAWTFDAKATGAKAKAIGPEIKAKANAIENGLEVPRGQGLASRTTSLIAFFNRHFVTQFSAPAAAPRTYHVAYKYRHIFTAYIHRRLIVIGHVHRLVISVDWWPQTMSEVDMPVSVGGANRVTWLKVN